VTAAYHDACHLAHAQGIRDAPRRLLAAVPELALREIAIGEICCGSAGVYNLLQPQAGRDLGDRKAAAVAATARVLAAEGCDVVVPPDQGCCGALSLHSGRRDEAVRFAARTAEVFTRSGVDVVVVNAAGCGSAMKEYADLGVTGPPVRDLSEWLVELGPVAPRHPVPVTVAYHDACHLAHAQGVRDAPRRLLASVPRLVLREIADGEICCGSAGVYNLLQPRVGRDLGDRKAAAVAATGADLLVSANPGCSMQIAAALRRAGHELPVAHVAEVLDIAIRGAPPPWGVAGRTPTAPDGPPAR